MAGTDLMDTEGPIGRSWGCGWLERRRREHLCAPTLVVWKQNVLLGRVHFPSLAGDHISGKPSKGNADTMCESTDEPMPVCVWPTACH